MGYRWKVVSQSSPAGKKNGIVPAKGVRSAATIRDTRIWMGVRSGGALGGRARGHKVSETRSAPKGPHENRSRHRTGEGPDLAPP